MLEIPTNANANSQVENLAKSVLKDLTESGYSCRYKCDCGNATIAKKVGKMFVDKGYYAKINYFVESWKGMQCLVVSKNPLSDATGRMIYSEFIY